MKLNSSTKVEDIGSSPNIANAMLGAVPSVVYNEDCVEGMKRFSDNHFDLAIVDPPYGIKNMNAGDRGINGWSDWRGKEWDNAIPTNEYFTELKRVSKNQIIWGGNYFPLEPTKCWIIWDKGQRDFSLADGEMAWTSFDKAMRIFELSRGTANAEDKIHPTQKPVRLYEWILSKFAKEGDLILDTHIGSGSIRIACQKNGFNLTGFEIDEDYYKAQEKRFKDFVSQLRMF